MALPAFLPPGDDVGLLSVTGGLVTLAVLVEAPSSAVGVLVFALPLPFFLPLLDGVELVSVSLTGAGGTCTVVELPPAAASSAVGVLVCAALPFFLPLLDGVELVSVVAGAGAGTLAEPAEPAPAAASSASSAQLGLGLFFLPFRGAELSITGGLATTPEPPELPPAPPPPLTVGALVCAVLFFLSLGTGVPLSAGQECAQSGALAVPFAISLSSSVCTPTLTDVWTPTSGMACGVQDVVGQLW